MKVLILADPQTRSHLCADIVAAGWAVCGVAAEARVASEMLKTCTPDLLVADADIDFPGVTALAAKSLKDGLAVAFVASRDPMVNEVLSDYAPFGFVPRGNSGGAVAGLLAKARRDRARRPTMRASRMVQDRRAGRELWAGGLMLIAVMIALRLPGLTSSGLGGAPFGYLLVAAFGVAAAACLFSERRPVAAGVQTVLVAVVAMLPTT